jgi:translation elongation factor EF-4
MEVLILDGLKRDGNEFCINLIELSEMVDVLHAADGALLVVDALKGVSAQTETLLQQALIERVPLVLVISAMQHTRGHLSQHRRIC